MAAAAVLAMGAAACSTTTTSTRTHRSTKAQPIRSRDAAPAATVAPAYLDAPGKDRDNDADRNDDDEGALGYGRPAGSRDRRLSVALVTRYLAAAAAENGAEGCRLLVPFVAESLAEEDGHSQGLQGKTCRVVLTKLFRRYHRPLVEKQASLRVIGVRIDGDKALAILDFPAIPEVRQITERRRGRKWRLLSVLDGMLE